MQEEIKEMIAKKGKAAWVKARLTSNELINPHAFQYGYTAAATKYIELMGEFALFFEDCSLITYMPPYTSPPIYLWLISLPSVLLYFSFSNNICVCLLTYEKNIVYYLI